MTGKTNVRKKNKNKSPAIESENKKNSSFPIVAIGASAGGLEAFEKFFGHLTKAGMAYVVVTHLDRDHESILPTLIKKYTALPVVLIKTGIHVQPDTIYVIPPKKNVTINHGILKLIEQSEPHYTNLPINYFFSSLAEDQGENAIAIILSGSGSDGSQGLRDIKENGGLTIVQDPLTADFDGMPRNAINTGLVDYVMTAEEIPLQLVKYINYGKVKEGKISQGLQQILLLLRAHTGHDFSHYKLNTICRRIEKQMYSHHIKKLQDYIHFLRFNRHEVDNLFRDLLIGVTRFFRDPKAFNALKRKVLLSLLKKKPKDYCIRVWVPACSTGEEAYSIAIILRECMDEIKKYFNVQIFGTDIDLSSLEIARSGLYPETIVNDVGPERLKRFFLKDQNNFKINKEIRSMVIFGEQNIIKDPPFTKLDLICCRNLLIYLSMDLQKRLIPLFHYSLRSKGILFLGISEATLGFTDHFQLLDKKWKIFERKDDVIVPHAILEFADSSRFYDAHNLPALEQNNVNEKLDFIQAINSFLLKHYMSPCIIVNKKGDILHVHGHIEPYLKITNKKMNLTLADVSYPEIKMALIPAIRRAALSKTEVICNNLKIKKHKKTFMINLTLIPILNVNMLHDLILIIFKEVVQQKPAKLGRGKSLKQTNLKLEEVVTELRYTKENLQATIEELESGNEELQSANEELQSTNEEIETSKEELQSLNEELIIVNTELQNMIDQLASVNDDMNNLFNSTEIAAFFLDNDLCIKRFTPRAQDFIHLIQSDIGRSIRHFSTTIKYEKLAENAEEVLKTLVQKNIEVKTKDHRWYHIRILPYRTLANMIDGVIITLTDVTRFKEYESKLTELNKALQDSLTFTENIVNTLREPLLVLDKDLKIISANHSFYNLFKINESSIIGNLIYDIEQWDTPELHELLEQILKNQSSEHHQLKHDFPGIGRKTNIINAQKICAGNSDADKILLTIEEHE